MHLALLRSAALGTAVVVSTALPAAAPGPVAVRCDPGGVCTTPVAPTLRAVAVAAGLADLAAVPLPGVRREVRVWGSDAPPRRGRLRRFVEDTAGRVTAEEVSWLTAAGAARAGAREVWCGGAAIRRGAGVKVCTAERVGMPYAANRLRTLDARGVRTLRGRAGRARPPATCVDVCLGPGYTVVELRDGRNYRTYGYPVGTGAQAPQAVYALFHAF